jgi:hypothetical protein
MKIQMDLTNYIFIFYYLLGTFGIALIEVWFFLQDKLTNFVLFPLGIILTIISISVIVKLIGITYE